MASDGYDERSDSDGGRPSFDEADEDWFAASRRETRRPSQRPSRRPSLHPVIDDPVADGWFYESD